MKSVVLFNIILLLVGIAMGLKDPICGLKPFAEGNGYITCMAYMPSFSYNLASSQCVDWIYGGCGANANIFKTKEECEAKCKE